jgi:hypothetical protein
MPGIPRDTNRFINAVPTPVVPIAGSFRPVFNVFANRNKPVLDFQSVRDNLMSWSAEFLNETPGATVVLAASALVNIAIVLGSLNESSLIHGLSVIPLNRTLAEYVADVNLRISSSYLAVDAIDPMIERLLVTATTLVKTGSIQSLNVLMLPSNESLTYVASSYAVYHALVPFTDVTPSDVFSALTGTDMVKRKQLEVLLQKHFGRDTPVSLPPHLPFGTRYVEHVLRLTGSLLEQNAMHYIQHPPNIALLERLPLYMASAIDISEFTFFDSLVAQNLHAPYKGILPFRFNQNAFFPVEGDPDRFGLYPITALVLHEGTPLSADSTPDLVSRPCVREPLPPDLLTRTLSSELHWNGRLAELHDNVLQTI